LYLYSPYPGKLHQVELEQIINKKNKNKIMWSKSLFPGAFLSLVLSAAVQTAAAVDAPVITNNKYEPTYEVELQNKDNSTVRGSFTTWAAENGEGIIVHVELSGVPKDTFLSSYIPTPD
jgi:hypothetical protein